MNDLPFKIKIHQELTEDEEILRIANEENLIGDSWYEMSQNQFGTEVNKTDKAVSVLRFYNRIKVIIESSNE